MSKKLFAAFTLAAAVSAGPQNAVAQAQQETINLPAINIEKGKKCGTFGDKFVIAVPVSSVSEGVNQFYSGLFEIPHACMPGFIMQSASDGAEYVVFDMNGLGKENKDLPVFHKDDQRNAE